MGIFPPGGFFVGERMFYYSLYGLLIESEVEFVQLVVADGSLREPDVIIKQENCIDEVTDYLKAHDSYRKRYDIGFKYSCFFNKGGYYVIKNGNTIVFEPIDGYTPQMLSPWLLGFAIAMILLQRNTLAIHCSAVCAKGDGSNNDVILISGYSGAGKSSLTRKLLERGYKLMTDDVAAVKCEEGVTVYSAFPYQKLCRNEVEKRNLDQEKLIYIDEDKDKFFVPVGEQFCDVPGKIRCMVFIMVGNVDNVQVKKLSGLDQLMVVRENLFLSILSGEWMNSQEVLNMCLKMAGECPVYVVTRPKDVDSLDVMADTVMGI